MEFLKTLDWTTIIVTAITSFTTLFALYFKIGGKMSKIVSDSETRIRTFTDSSIRSLNGTASAIVHSFPTECWVKLAVTDDKGNLKFIMHELNDKYEKSFGMSRLGYIGKTDLEAGWDRDTANAFFDHDSLIWATGKAQTFKETVNGKEMMFHKLRLESPAGNLKGVMGFRLDNMTPVE